MASYFSQETEEEEKQYLFSQPQPQAASLLKPRPLWSVRRAANIVKLVSPTITDQSFDTNIRLLAKKIQISPEGLLKMNPIIACRCLGISEITISKTIPSYYSLASGTTLPYYWLKIEQNHTLFFSTPLFYSNY